jgi:hypothetical protein
MRSRYPAAPTGSSPPRSMRTPNGSGTGRMRDRRCGNIRNIHLATQAFGPGSDGDPRGHPTAIRVDHQYGAGLPSWRSVQARPNPRRRLILPHLEHAPGRLDTAPDAPPGDEGARERCIGEIDGDRIIQHPAHSRRRHRQRSEPSPPGNGQTVGRKCLSRYPARRSGHDEHLKQWPYDTTNGKRLIATADEVIE